MKHVEFFSKLIMYQTEDRIIVGAHSSSPFCINAKLSIFEENVLF